MRSAGDETRPPRRWARIDRLAIREVTVATARALWSGPAFDLAAQLGFYGLLSLFPFAVFLLTIIGYLPIPGLEEEIFRLLHALMPAEAVQLFESTVRGLVVQRRGGLLALSVAGAILTASSGMMALMNALTRLYGVDEKRSWPRRRLMSIGLTIVAALLVIVATAALLVGPNLVRRASEYLGAAAFYDEVWRWLRWPTTMLAMNCLLACLYWALPPVKQAFRLITPGSVTGVVLWVAVSFGFGRYTARLGNYNKTYGALGAAIALLMWIYLSGLIVLVGGTINAALWRRRAAVRDPNLVPQGPKG